jgi:hypothetical protein
LQKIPLASSSKSRRDDEPQEARWVWLMWNCLAPGMIALRTTANRDR